MRPDEISGALITEDGVVTGISARRERHPVFGTDSRAARVEIPLTPEQSALAGYVDQDGRLGFIQCCLRSAVAQMGIDAFHPEVTTMRVESSRLVVDTSITMFHSAFADRVFRVMNMMVRSGQKPVVSRAGIFPAASRVDADGVQDLLDERRLVVPQVEVEQDGAITFPLQLIRYSFCTSLLQSQNLRRLLSRQSARALIRERRTVGECPDMLAPGEYLVCGLELDTHDHHVMLQRDLIGPDGRPSGTFHGEAGLLEARRTAGGDRQAEIVNMNGHAESLRPLRLKATVHRAASLKPAGV